MGKAAVHVQGILESIEPFKCVVKLSGEDRENKIQEIAEQIIIDRVNDKVGKKTREKELEDQKWYVMKKVVKNLKWFLEKGVTKETIAEAIDIEYDRIILPEADEEQRSAILEDKYASSWTK